MNVMKIQELAKQVRGVSYKPTDLHDSLNESSVVLLRANNICDGKINFDDVVYVDKSKVSKEQYLRKGDILVCASSGSKDLVGKSASIEVGGECTFGAFCKVVRPKSEYADYLGKYFQSNAYRKQIASLAVGANINNIRNEHINSLTLPIYNDETNAKIVDILSYVQSIIWFRKQQLENLDKLIKARFVEMFGAKGNVKVVKKTLGNICEFQQGTQIPVEKQYEEYVCGYERFLRIIDYTQPPQPPRYVSVVGKKVDEKSVVIVRYGATAGFVGRGYCGILANNLFEVIPDERVMSKDFLFLALKYGSFEMLIHDKVFGAAMPALSFSMMNDITIVVPNLTEQEIFTDFAAQIDKSKFIGDKLIN